MTIEVLEFRALNDLSRRTQKLGKSPSRCGPKSEGKESLYISSPYSGAVFFGTWNICRILPEIVKVVYIGPFSQGWGSVFWSSNFRSFWSLKKIHLDQIDLTNLFQDCIDLSNTKKRSIRKKGIFRMFLSVFPSF